MFNFTPDYRVNRYTYDANQVEFIYATMLPGWGRPPQGSGATATQMETFWEFQHFWDFESRRNLYPARLSYYLEMRAQAREVDFIWEELAFSTSCKELARTWLSHSLQAIIWVRRYEEWVFSRLKELEQDGVVQAFEEIGKSEPGKNHRHQLKIRSTRNKTETVGVMLALSDAGLFAWKNLNELAKCLESYFLFDQERPITYAIQDLHKYRTFGHDSDKIAALLKTLNFRIKTSDDKKH